MVTRRNKIKLPLLFSFIQEQIIVNKQKHPLTFTKKKKRKQIIY